MILNWCDVFKVVFVFCCFLLKDGLCLVFVSVILVVVGGKNHLELPGARTCTPSEKKAFNLPLPKKVVFLRRKNQTKNAYHATLYGKLSLKHTETNNNQKMLKDRPFLLGETLRLVSSNTHDLLENSEACCSCKRRRSASSCCALALKRPEKRHNYMGGLQPGTQPSSPKNHLFVSKPKKPTIKNDPRKGIPNSFSPCLTHFAHCSSWLQLSQRADFRIKSNSSRFCRTKRARPSLASLRRVSCCRDEAW